MAPERNRWDDEYDSYREDQAESRTLSVDPTSDSQWYQDSRYDS